MGLPIKDIGLGAATGGLYNVGKASGLFKKSAKPIDISLQQAQARDLANRNRMVNSNLSTDLKPLTADYSAASDKARAELKTAFGTNKNEFLQSTDANTKQATDLMRSNLYSDKFSALPDIMREVRQQSAAGGGLNTGSYQQAVKETGIDTSRAIAGGERDIQLQGLQNRQGAQQQVYGAFNDLSNKLNASQMETITKVLDTGREDLVRKAATDMGINEQETQSLLDLMNFQQSGQLAQDTAADANKTALLTALISGGSKVAGAKAGGTV